MKFMVSSRHPLGILKDMVKEGKLDESVVKFLEECNPFEKKVEL